MSFPSLRPPHRAAVGTDGGARVNRDAWLGAARRTDAELWELAQLNRTRALATPCLPPTPALGADSDAADDRSLPAVPTTAPRTVPKLAPTAAYVRRPLAPPRVRVLSFLQQRRGGTETVRTMMRRLHFKRAELLPILRDLERAGLGRLHVRCWRSSFAHRHYEALAFSLTPSGRDPAVLLV